jgi:5-methylcytosine-specific restriction protein B
MRRIQAVLERKGQVILYGPPGTGKTYWAERTGCELAARTSFGAPFDHLTSEQKMDLRGDGDTRRGKVRTCCFHPAYGYEDFLEGFRPEATNGHMQFVPQDGIFKQLCKDASASPHEKFYLIIDEMNRGDIPRIFGELLMVLEKDKRGKSLLLPLTKQPFQVPDNVYLIGTMNTADRSIALLDTALRRRFGFIELMPDTELLKNTEAGGIPLAAWLESLNGRIRQYVGRDARNLQIGHAYFMQRGRPIADVATLARVVQEDILPLLEEYCYEDYIKLEQIMGSGLVDAKAQVIRHSLFDPSQQENLVQALLAPCPEVTTSAQAVAAEEQQEAIQEDESSDNGDDEQDV